MVCTLHRFSSFERHLKAIIKKYPLAESAIVAEINGLANNPIQGDCYPGFHPYQVRKVRVSLRAYHISSSGGLRLIFLYFPDTSMVAPLVIYKKGKPASEHEVKKMVLGVLHEIIQEMA
jgi:hypothetical protein